jgi:DNA-binding transcriptional MocR family regulator
MAFARAHRPLLFEQVAARMREAIHAGILAPGDRLPSVRELSQQERVSISTVLQAYQQLEAWDLVQAKPQSGHYVRLLRREVPREPPVSRPPSAACEPSVAELVRSLYKAAGNERIVNLGSARPCSSMLPTRKLSRLIAALAREAGGVGVEYDMPPGWPALRQQLARRSLAWGCQLGPDDFVTTCGAAEAVHLSLLAVANRSDIVAVESPAYYGVLQLLEMLGLRALEMPTHPREGMQLDALEAALKRQSIGAVLVVTNFSNPLGASMSDEKKEALVALCERHGVPLIEDDIYGDLYYGPARPRAAKSFDRTGNVLYCSSFSKTLAAGFRVGWAAPGRFLERFELLKFSLSVATPTLPQMAIAEFLQQGGYDRFLRTLRRELARQMEHMRQLVATTFPDGTRMTRPEGGAILWVQMPASVDALKLHDEALQRGISVAPGPIFSSTGRYRSCIRLNTGNPDLAQVEAAVRTLAEIAHRLAGSAQRLLQRSA